METERKIGSASLKNGEAEVNCRALSELGSDLSFPDVYWSITAGAKNTRKSEIMAAQTNKMLIDVSRYSKKRNGKSL